MLKDPGPPWGSNGTSATGGQAASREADRDNLLGDEPPTLATTTSFAEPTLAHRDRMAHDFRVLRRQMQGMEDAQKWAVELRDGQLQPSPLTSNRALLSVAKAAESGGAAFGEHPSIDQCRQVSTSRGTLPSHSLTGSQHPVSRRQVGDQLISAIVNGTWTLAHRVEQSQMDQAAVGCTAHCSESNMVRRWCIHIANSWWFDQAVLLLIIIGSFLMVLDAPGLKDRDPTLKSVIAVCDELLLYVFTLEMAIKVVAMGVVIGPKTYLRDNWNKLDALVVVSGWFSVLTNQLGECQIPGLFFCSETSGGSGFSFGVLRTIRILRPLRAINQFPTMKHLVQTLLQSLPELLEMGVLCAFILVLFGIIGVQLYMGVLRQHCSGGAVSDAAAATTSLCSLNGEGYGSGARCPSGSACSQDGGANPNDGVTSFDNLFVAIIALFQSITLEGWVDIMYDIRKVKGLHHDLYFITLILFGSLFMTNLVVGVLIQKVTQASNKTRELSASKPNSRHLSQAATRFISASTVTFLSSGVSSTKAPEARWRRQLSIITSSPNFSVVVLVLILLNTAVLALDNVLHPSVLEYFNYIFTGIFFTEMCMKVGGLTFRVYCRDWFNVFDFTIVGFSVLEIVLAKTVNINGPSTTILRTFRLLRVLKLARSMKSLGKILDALMGSLRAIINLFWLLLLFMFVCALMGMNLFGVTETSRESGDEPKWDFEEEGMYAGRMARPNFSTFMDSMATVFILITGENWNEIMYVAVKHNGMLSAFYFVFVIIAGNYILLNLFLAVLVDKFDTVGDGGDDQKSQRLRFSRPLANSPPPPSGCHCFFRLRLRLWVMIRHPYFDSLIYGLIAVSAVNLAMDAPNVKDPESKRLFFVLDSVLSAFFVLEAVVKIVVHGFVLAPNAYLRDSWNVLDFFVVCTSVLNTLLQRTSLINAEVAWLSWLKGLRALRALRPLRMVSRNEGMKAVVGAIFKAVPAMFDVLLVLALFLLIFSILGVQLLKNKMWMCSCQDDCPEKKFNPDGKFWNQSDAFLCQGTCPLSTGGLSECVWQRDPNWSFDNIFVSGLTLFEVASLEMWPDIMFRAVDGVSADEGPQYNKNQVVMFFFILYIFVMSFFILNLFVGVVIDKFSDVRNEMTGLAVMTAAQRRWIATQRMLLNARPRPLILPPESRWRQLALQLVSTREFETAILGMIVTNIAVICTNMYHASSGLKAIQENANTVFLAMFTMESTIKLFALNRLFFIDPWSVFDLIIVVGGLLSAASRDIQDQAMIDTTMFRAFRIARIFRLVKSLKSLRKFFETLVMSISSLVDVGTLLLLLFFVYAVAGMALFGDIQIEGNPTLSMMSEDANFGSFYLAMMLLFRISTGESWNALMHDCFTGARCVESPHETHCGNTAIAIVFFVSFMLVGSFVFLNLFIAVIIEKLFDVESTADMEDEAEQYGKNKIGITSEDIENFVVEWSRLVQNGDHYMPTAKLGTFLNKVQPPLGFSGEAMVAHRQLQLMTSLGIMDHGGCVHFAETLWRMASMVVGADMSNVADYELMRSLHKRILKALPTPNTKAGSVVYLAAHVNASLKLQSRWRARQVRQKLSGNSSISLSSGVQRPSARFQKASMLIGKTFSMSKVLDSETSKVSFPRFSRRRSESRADVERESSHRSEDGASSRQTGKTASQISHVATPSGACVPDPVASHAASVAAVAHGGDADISLLSPQLHSWNSPPLRIEQGRVYVMDGSGAASPESTPVATGAVPERSELLVPAPAAVQTNATVAATPVEPGRTAMEDFFMACTSAATESPTASRRQSAAPPISETWSVWRSAGVPSSDDSFSCGGCGERFCVQSPATEDDRITLVVQQAEKSTTAMQRPETCSL